MRERIKIYQEKDFSDMFGINPERLEFIHEMLKEHYDYVETDKNNEELSTTELMSHVYNRAINDDRIDIRESYFVTAIISASIGEFIGKKQNETKNQ